MRTLNHLSLLLGVLVLFISCETNNIAENRLAGGWVIEYIIYKEDSSYLRTFYTNAFDLKLDKSCIFPSNDDRDIFSQKGSWKIEKFNREYQLKVDIPKKNFFNQRFTIDTLFTFKNEYDSDGLYMIMRNDSCEIHCYKLLTNNWVGLPQ